MTRSGEGDETSISRYEEDRALSRRAEQQVMVPRRSRRDEPAPMLSAEGVLEVLWRRKLSIMVMVALCLCGAVIYIQVATPRYLAESRIYIEHGLRILPQSPGLMAPSENYLRTQGALITSSPVLSLAASMPGMDQMKTVGTKDPVQRLRSAVEVEVGRKDDIITVWLDSPYQAEVAPVLNNLVQAFVKYQTDEGRSTSQDVLKILQHEKAERTAELAQKREALFDFIRINGTGSYDEKANSTNPVIERMNKLSDSLTAAQLEAMNARAAAAAAEALKDEPAKVRKLAENEQKNGTFTLADTRLAEQLQQQLTESELRLAVLQRQYPDGHPIIQNARIYIEQLNRKLAEQDRVIARAYGEAVRARAAAAKAKEDVFRQQFDEAQKEAFNVNVKGAEYARLHKDVERMEKLLETLENRINELTITQDSGPVTVKVVDEAVTPRRPYHPQKPRTLALAMMLGLMLGGALALVREKTDQRLKSAEDVVNVLGVPVLGVVPQMSGSRTLVSRGQKMHLEPLSDVAEAIRTVRTAVYFGVPGLVPRTLLVTSPTPGDGKSTMASNLAIAMAQAGRRTILVDADLRSPMVDEIFELKGVSGLAGVLSGAQTLEASTSATDVANLHVLPSGPVPANPAELLNSDGFRRLLEELTSRYDCVVLDSPPVLPVTDARILGAYCDVTLLVLRAGKSGRRQSEHACAALGSVGARVLGAVVNGVSRRQARSSHYAPYGYGYYGNGESSIGRHNGRRGGAGGAHRRLGEIELLPRQSRWLPGDGGGDADDEHAAGESNGKTKA